MTGAKAIAGTVSYNASTKTATFTPTSALAASTTYTVTVTGVTSSGGTALSTWSSSFTTAAAAGGGGTATKQYQAPLLSANETAIDGQVSVDTSGNVAVQVTRGMASTSLAVQFCLVVNAIGNLGNNPTCISVGTVTTDGSGNGSTTVKFPQSGYWAGDFYLYSGSTMEYITGLMPGVSGETYMSTLVPESTVDGSGIATGSNPTQDPLTSGTVSSSNGSITFTVTGASPNTTYATDQSESVYLDGSGTYELSTFTTDGSGDGTSTVKMSGDEGDLFEVIPQTSGAGYIGGFSVPK